MKNLTLIISIFFISSISIGQNIKLSNNIGEVNRNYNYKKFTKSIGEADSISHYNLWKGKSKPYYMCFYYDQSLILKFTSTNGKKLKSQKISTITIQKKSKIKLNGVLITKITTSNVSSFFGKPKRKIKEEEGIYIEYVFTEGDFFSLVVFEFNLNGDLNEIKINFGKY